MQLGQTFIAREQIRRHMDVRPRAGLAGRMRKSLARLSARQAALEQLRTRRGRRSRQQRFPECLKSFGGPLRVDFDVAAVVAHPAGEFEEVRKAIDERPEANALHPATDAPPLGSDGGCGAYRLPQDQRRSCGRGLAPPGESEPAVLRQMQRRPGVRRAVHEPMTGDVIARIEAVEIHAHALELVGAVVRERARALIARASRALLRQGLA